MFYNMNLERQRNDLSKRQVETPSEYTRTYSLNKGYQLYYLLQR